jgi:hypothetical protein
LCLPGNPWNIGESEVVQELLNAIKDKNTAFISLLGVSGMWKKKTASLFAAACKNWSFYLEVPASTRNYLWIWLVTFSSKQYAN